MPKIQKGSSEARKNLDELEILRLVILENTGLHKRVLDKISSLRSSENDNLIDQAKKKLNANPTKKK